MIGSGVSTGQGDSPTGARPEAAGRENPKSLEQPLPTPTLSRCSAGVVSRKAEAEMNARR